MKAATVPYIILTTIAILVVIIINYHGIGITSDSIHYVDTASSMASNEGYRSISFHTQQREPQKLFPPGLSTILSIGIRLGFSVETTGLIVNTISFIGLLTTLYFATYLTTSNSIPAIIICLLLFHPSLLSQYTAIMSEALFIALMMSGVFALYLYINKCNLSILLSSALLLGMATIVRYIGLVYVLVAILYLLLYRRESLLHVLAFSVVVLAPITLWFIYSFTITSSVVNRDFVIHIVPVSEILNGMRTIGGWFVPVVVRFRTGFAGLLAIPIIMAYYHFLRTSNDKKRLQLIWMLSAFQVAHVTFLLFSISFVDAAIPLSPRLLSPLYPLTVLTIVVILDGLDGGKKGFRILELAFLVFILFTSFLWIVEEQKDSNDYSSTLWKQSPLIDFVYTLPPEAIIYSNAPDVLYWHTQRTAIFIPSVINSNTLLPNFDFNHEVEAMREDLNNGAYLLYSYKITWRQHLPTLDELQPLPPTQVISD